MTERTAAAFPLGRRRCGVRAAKSGSCRLNETHLKPFISLAMNWKRYDFTSFIVTLLSQGMLVAVGNHDDLLLEIQTDSR